MKKEQESVDVWFKHAGAEYWKPLEMMARLTEETGELAREINHRFGPKKKKAEEDVNEVGDEMADILVTLCCIANSLKIDLDESFNRVLDKLYARDTALRGNQI
ncbi:MAG: nucleotide pyrophosphohydrolase [Nanoarchaeota archaeon]